MDDISHAAKENILPPPPPPQKQRDEDRQHFNDLQQLAEPMGEFFHGCFLMHALGGLRVCGFAGFRAWGVGRCACGEWEWGGGVAYLTLMIRIDSIIDSDIGIDIDIGINIDIDIGIK